MATTMGFQFYILIKFQCVVLKTIMAVHLITMEKTSTETTKRLYKQIHYNIIHLATMKKTYLENCSHVPLNLVFSCGLQFRPELFTVWRDTNNGLARYKHLLLKQRTSSVQNY